MDWDERREMRETGKTERDREGDGGTETLRSKSN